MVCSYRRKTPVVYTPKQLEDAVKAVTEGSMSCSGAARKCNIPPTTLFGHVKKQFGVIGAGHPTVLTNKEE